MAKKKFELPKLVKNSNDYYMLRFRISKPLIPYFRKEQISKSLELSNKRLALQKAHIFHSKYLDILHIESMSLLSNLQIQDMVDDYLNNIIKQPFVKNKTEVYHRQEENYESAVKKFVAWFEDKDVTQRTKNHNIDFITQIFLPMVGAKNSITTNFVDIIKLKNQLAKFPNRNYVEYRYLSVEEMLKLKVPKDKLVSDSRLKAFVKTIKMFFKFCYRNKFIDFDPSVDVTVALDKTIKRRLAFTVEEIRNLLDVLMTIESDIKYMYFIYIFTGMRREEAFKAIIKSTNDGLLYFDLSSNQGFKLKTNSSFRRVPLHKKLIEIGLTYEIHERAKKITSVMETGRQFNVLYKTQVTDDKKKTLHSLRHTVNNVLKSARVDTLAREELLGHEHTGTNNTIYAEDYPLEILREELNKLDYGW